LKLILVQEFSPKEIIIDFPNKSAIVILKSRRDQEEILEKYTEFINYKTPDFLLWRYQPNTQQTTNPLQPGIMNPMQQPQ